MKEFQIAYIPIGVPTFHLESAQKEFERSAALLKALVPPDGRTAVPEGLLLSGDLLNGFLDTLEPDLIVLQNATFANASYTTEILRRFNCPLLLWTLREPVIDGGRLRLNSLTGAYSAASVIRVFRKEPFEYVFGSPDEKGVRRKIEAVIRAARVKRDLRSLTLSQVGHTPEGFGFGRALDSEAAAAFGVKIECIETRELIDKAKTYSEDEIQEYLSDAESRTAGLSDTPSKNREDFARLYKAYAEYVKTHHIGALASRCWPDFFTAFGTPVCLVLAMLNDMGVAASCEADAYGALSMYVCMRLTGSPVFFGDPVSLDENEGTITYWHCGTAACSLAREDTGARIGVHCNRKIGPTLEFGCRAAKDVTVFRIGRTPEGRFRFFIIEGEALDKPKQFNGTSVVVKTKQPPSPLVGQSVLDGWEPHFVVAYGNIAEELTALAHMLNMKICDYKDVR